MPTYIRNLLQIFLWKKVQVTRPGKRRTHMPRGWNRTFQARSSQAFISPAELTSPLLAPVRPERDTNYDHRGRISVVGRRVRSRERQRQSSSLCFVFSSCVPFRARGPPRARAMNIEKQYINIGPCQQD